MTTPSSQRPPSSPQGAPPPDEEDARAAAAPDENRSQPAERPAASPARSALDEKRGGFPFALVVGGVLVLGVLALGISPRLHRAKAVEAAHTEALAPVRVLVSTVTRAPARAELTLPATAMPFQSTKIYAKTNGFVRKTLVDIGDKVKAGQLLAEIEVPESEEELRVARARLEEAEANAKVTAGITDRRVALAEKGVVSAEDADTARGRTISANAALKTTRAEVQRIGAVRNYQRVVAPFDGVVTKRLVSRGALVSTSGGVELFEVADIQTLRVSIEVPQNLASSVALGMKASVFETANPKKVVEGTVARTAGALDKDTRTLLTEVQIAGDRGVLAGSYVMVKVVFDRATRPLLVPSNALAVRKEGTLLVRFVEPGVLRPVKVTLGRDLGKELEILDGIDEGDRVVQNPADTFVEGLPARIAEPRASASAAPSAAPSASASAGPKP